MVLKWTNFGTGKEALSNLLYFYERKVRDKASLGCIVWV